MKKLLLILFLTTPFWVNGQLSGVNDASFNVTDIGFGAGSNLNPHMIYSQLSGKILVGHNNTVRRFLDDGLEDPTFNQWAPPAFSVKDYKLLLQSKADSSLIISYGVSSAWFNIFRTNKNGQYDPFFDTTLRFDQDIRAVARQMSGKLILGGDFLTAGLDSVFRIVRLYPNGQRDYTFNTGTGFNSAQSASQAYSVFHLLTDSLDRILVAGRMTEYNGQAIKSVVRLLPNGTLDTTFNLFAPLNGTIHSIKLQNNGKILIAGIFNIGGYCGLVRVHDDGSIDTSFSNGTAATGCNDYTQMHIMQDGRICMKGFLDDLNFVGVRILTPDGIQDPSFVTRRFDAYSSTPSFLSSDNFGRIIAGGTFMMYGNLGRNGFVRILPDGTPDSSFHRGYGFNGGYIYDVDLMPDGRHVVAGWFSNYNNFTTYGLAQIHPDGSVDTTFRYYGDSAGGQPPSYTQSFRKVSVLPNGKILVATNQSKLIRLFPNGIRDTTFNAQVGYLGFFYFEVFPDGKIVTITNYSSIGHTIIRLFPDGARDTSFQIGSFAESPEQFAFQPDGKVIVVGGILDYTFNGNTFTANNMLRLNTDGTVDQTFQTTLISANGINVVKVLDDGRILLGLNAGVLGSAGKVLRVMSNGQPDPTWTARSFGKVLAILVQPDGKVVATGSGSCSALNPCGSIIRLLQNGEYDTAFLASSGTGYSLQNNSYWPVNDVVFQPDWKVLSVGGFVSYNGTGRNGINRIFLADTLCGLPPTGIQMSIAGNTICNGDSITLYRVGGSLPPGGVYRWFSGSCGGTTLGFGDSITIAPSSTGSVFVRAEGGCGSTVCASVYINVLAFPQATLLGDTSLCTGQNTTLELSPFYGNYLWSTGEVTSTVTVATSGTYTVTVTNANGCSGAYSWNVTVSPYPNVNISASGPVSFCRGDSVVLSASPGLATWQWLKNGQPWGSNSQNLTVWSAGTYSCVGANSAGCSDSSGTIQVFVPCMPVDPAIDKINEANHPVKVYPNPAHDRLTIESQGGLMSLFNTNGELVYEGWLQEGSTEITLSHLAKGLYMVRVNTGVDVTSYKIMVRDF